MLTADTYTSVLRSTWDEHRVAVEQGLRKGSQAGLSGLAVLAGRVEDLARYAARLGVERLAP